MWKQNNNRLYVYVLLNMISGQIDADGKIRQQFPMIYFVYVKQLRPFIKM